MNFGTAAKIIKKCNDEFPAILLPYIYFLIFSLVAWKTQGYVQTDFILGLIVFIALSTFSAYYLFDAYSAGSSSFHQGKVRRSCSGTSSHHENGIESLPDRDVHRVLRCLL